uniref:Putative myosin-9 n=1 Tax=Culex tarsalis TaxID=7177 RepID=A0A1Q3EZM7_CULTA
MNGGGNPAVTLFSDPGQVQVANTSELQRAEEEEALEDQKRRQQELAAEVYNAFDDLIEDDHGNEDTLNSLSYASNYSEHPTDRDQQHQHPPPPAGVPSYSPAGHRFLDGIATKNGPPPAMASGSGDAHHHHQQHPQHAEVRHWKQLLESKTREFEHVTRQLHDKTREFDQKVNDLQKRLMLAEGERDRANMTRSQTHALLVESKTKVAEQEDRIGELKGKVRGLEEVNLKQEAELVNKNMMLQDALQKCRMLEQNAGQKATRHTDQLLKQAEEKYSAKVAMMQQQIDKLRGELEDRQHEVRRCEVRCEELQSLREQLMAERNETVQRLQDNLEESQHKCESLLAKTANLTGFGQDNMRLQTKVNALEQQTHDMQRTINTLTQRLETSNAELELMDSMLCAGGGDDAAADATAKRDDRTCTFAASRKNLLVGSTPINPNLKNTEDRVTKLKHELLICMNGQKEKRETIKRLETQLADRDREIQQLKKDESDALVQMNQYKEEAFRLGSKLKILEAELEKCYKKDPNNSKQSRSRSSFDKQDALEEKIFALQQEKLQLEDKLTKLDQDHARLQEKCKRLESETKSTDTVKLELEKQKFLLKDAQSECDRVKQLYIEISSCKDAVARELSVLKAQDAAHEMASLSEKVASLERALQLAELKCSEFGKLLEKEKVEHERLLRELHERQQDNASRREAAADKERKQAANSCKRCIDSLAEISKLEIQNLQLQNTCASHLREMSELKSALSESRATINDLHQKLDLKAERDQLIDDLKEKAAQFEEFMRNQNTSGSSSSGNSSTTRDSATSPQPQRPRRDQSVSTSPELQDGESRKVAREQEHKIREEMARAFAAEMKIIEEKFKGQFLKFEDNISGLRKELHDRTNELQVRNKEVEVLKFAIVNEREKITEILTKKNEEARALFDKQAEVMKKYRSELDSANLKVQFLESQLEEKRELIQAERDSMEKLIRQVTEERKQFHERELEVIEKFKEIEQEYNKSLEMVTEKYNTVKKTALNYKKYAEDKEQYMMKEYDRIKEGYNAALLKVQNRAKEALESKERSMQEKMSKLEAELYQARIKGGV